MHRHQVKKITLALLIAAMLAFPLSASALSPNTPKEEVVYANLAADGAVERVTVVNSFRLAAAGTIADYGEYSEAVNLTDKAALTMRRGRITVDAGAGSFYYQGELAGAELPWRIRFSYTLDGRSIAPEQLPGCSGLLAMTMAISRNPESDPFFYENYALQATVTLDGDGCADIVAPDATLASAGSSRTLSYIVFPNTDATLTWSAQVRNFTMDGVQLAGIALNFSVEDFDTQSFTADLDRLRDGAVQLDDGVYDLKEGVLTMDGKLPELADGVRELQDGVTELSDGVGRLRDGAFELLEGVGELRDGLGELVEGLPEFREGVGDLAEGVDNLARGSQTFYQSLLAGAGDEGSQQAALAEARQNLESATAAYLTALGNYSGLYGSAEALSAAAESARQAADQAAASLGGLSQARQQIAALQQAMDDGTAALSQAEQLGQLKAGLAFAQSLDDGAAAAENSAAALQAELDAAAAGLPAAQAAYEQALSSLITLSGAYGAATSAREIAGGYAPLHQGILQLDDRMPELAEGVEELQEGAEQLYDGADELYRGQSEYADGVAELDDRLPELTDGLGQLNDGVDGLAEGVTELADGVTELKDGTGELRDETSDMDSRIEEQIRELLGEYGGRDFTPRSFVSANNTQVLSVQFVLKSADITIPDRPAATAVAKEAETVWQRAAALGRYWQLLVDWLAKIFS